MCLYNLKGEMLHMDCVCVTYKTDHPAHQKGPAEV